MIGSIITNIILLVGVIAIWGFMWPLTSKAYREQDTAKTVVFVIVDVILAVVGIRAALGLLGTLMGAAWSILCFLLVLALIWFAVSRVAGNKK